MQKSLRALVADTPLRFPVFLEQLGDCLFIDWKARRSETGVMQFVYEQMRQILAASTDVTARIFVEPLDRDKVSSELVIDGGPWGTVHIFEQHGNLIEFEFRIDKSYWNSSDADWEPSILEKRIEPSFMLLANYNGRYNARQIFGDAKLSMSQLLVLRPRAALERVYNVGELPNKEWFDRYVQFRHNFLLELLGFCWRFVCLRRLEPKRGLTAKLIEAMKDYLAEQGLTYDCPADNTLREIANLVVEQLADRNLSASLFKARSLKVLAAKSVKS